jgi:hypothetical protein
MQPRPRVRAAVPTLGRYAVHSRQRRGVELGDEYYCSSSLLSNAAGVGKRGFKQGCKKKKRAGVRFPSEDPHSEKCSTTRSIGQKPRRTSPMRKRNNSEALCVGFLSLMYSHHPCCCCVDVHLCERER